MVVFTCNHCGDSLQKPKVEKHYMTKCKRDKSLTCVDCFKDFFGEEYDVHKKCITEEERYSAKGTVQNTVKKGENKQMQWTEMIKNIIATETNVPPSQKNIFKVISGNDNVPRKKKQFTNFIQNCCGRVNPADVENVWNIIEKYKAESIKKMNEEKAKQNALKKEDSGKVEDEVKEEKKDVNGIESKNKKKKRKSDEEAEVKEEAENVQVESKEDLGNKKKKKKRKSEGVKVEVEQKNGGVEDEVVTDKKRKSNEGLENKTEVESSPKKKLKKDEAKECVKVEETVENKKGKKKKNKGAKAENGDVSMEVEESKEVIENGSENSKEKSKKSKNKKPVTILSGVNDNIIEKVLSNEKNLSENHLKIFKQLSEQKDLPLKKKLFLKHIQSFIETKEDTRKIWMIIKKYKFVENTVTGHAKVGKGKVAKGNEKVANGNKKVTNGNEKVTNENEKVTNGNEKVTNGNEKVNNENVENNEKKNYRDSILEILNEKNNIPLVELQKKVCKLINDQEEFKPGQLKKFKKSLKNTENVKVEGDNVILSK